MQTIEQMEAERKAEILKEKYFEFFCIWKNAKGETKEKRSNTVESLYFYEFAYKGTIYQDKRYNARKRLQSILKSNS